MADIEVQTDVDVGATVVVDGSLSSDPDNDTLTYSWLLATPDGSTAELDRTSGQSAQFVADIAGEFGLTLTVSDGKLESDTTVVVTAGGAGDNRPPIAVVGDGFTVEIETPVTLDGTQSHDPDEDALFFDWLLEGAPDGSDAQLSDPASPTPTLIPDVAGNYEISLVVSDGQLDSEPAPLIITATGPANQPPLADAGRDVAVATGEVATLDGSQSSDPDGSALTYSWTLVDAPAGSSATLVDADTAQPSLPTDVDGTYVAELIVSDGELDSEPDTVTVTAVTGNVPPNAHAGSDQSVEVGDVVQLDGTDSDDNEGDSLTYEWEMTDRPNGSSAQLSDPGSPAPTFVADAAGEYVVELVVNDGESDSTPDTITVTAADPNQQPVADAGPDQEGRVDRAVLLDGNASDDPDGDPLDYSWEWVFKPQASNATLSNKLSDAASFTPDVAGTYTIALTVNDGSADSVADMVTVTVIDAFPATEGDVVLTEIMANPTQETDRNGEWIELYNPTNSTWNLRDCVLEDLDSDSKTIDGSVVVRPMSYVTLARSANPGFGPDHVYGNGFSLANEDDEVLLLCDGVEIAQLAYLDGFVTAGSSAALLRGMDEVENDDTANWCASTTDYNGDYGTPGAPNEFQNSCP